MTSGDLAFPSPCQVPAESQQNGVPPTAAPRFGRSRLAISGRMTGVHARFPPQAGIRPGVDAGLGGPSHLPAPSLPPPKAAGGRGLGAKVALADPSSSTGLIPLTRKRVVNDPALRRSLGKQFVGKDKVLTPGPDRLLAFSAAPLLAGIRLTSCHWPRTVEARPIVLRPVGPATVSR